jgi:hypothetical protein
MRALLTLVALAAASPSEADASPLYERALMVRADALCGLFEPAVGRALKVSAAQARSAALRSGVTAAELKATEARAGARAAAAGCGSPDLKLAAERVRDAYAGWGRQLSLDVDGPWRVRRTVLPDRWRAAQEVSFEGGRLTFGLTSGDARPAAAVRFSDARAPSAVRLRFRDAGRETRPDPAGKGVARRVWAASAEASPVGLTPQGGGSARLYRWPVSTAELLSELDPRESLWVEFVFPGTGGREDVRAARVRVGDLAVALAFLEIGS